jgi:3-hydroxybutyryl-CoA dehydrogenase
MTGVSMQNVAVIGAGVMGTGVAQSLAQAGLQVVLMDVSGPALERAQAKIRNDLRMHALLGGAPLRESLATIVGRIRCTGALTELGAPDFLIENVVEKWAVKQPLYAELDACCPAHCVFAANTSAIPITRLGSATRRPAQVIGMHFMNPVPLKSTVEVIKGFHTSPQTIASAYELLRLMGKEAILVEDSPGFVSNRVLMLTINEAIHLVHEGVAAAEDVDKLFKNCFGHKMGPLETADLIGLDTILYSIDVLHECFADSKYRPSVLLKKMVDAGLHGRKSGRGFYEYSHSAGHPPGHPQE